MKKLFPLVVLLGVLIHIMSCTYEDGPAISLRSKTSRLTGTWLIILNTSGGSNFGITQKIIFEEDGQYAHQIFDQGNLVDDEKGSWEWIVTSTILA